MRVLDLLIACANAALLSALFRPWLPPGRAPFIGLVLLAFYLGTPENCHVEPDPWMLLPTLLALHLRCNKASPIAEGFCAGLACLFKPYAIVPPAAAWCASQLIGPLRWRALLRDTAGMILGGLLAGSLWMGWLWLGGGWDSFWHSIREWGPSYRDSILPLAARLRMLIDELLPWSAVHLLAIPISLAVIGRAIWRRPTEPTHVLFAAFYLGWVFVGAYLQFAYPYHVLPATLLALSWFVAWLCRMTGPQLYLSAATLAVALLLTNPLLQPSKLALWPRCWSPADSNELRDELSFAPMYPQHLYRLLEFDRAYEAARERGDLHGPPLEATITHWVDLAAVADFLRGQNIGDGELICYHPTTANLYPELGVLPGSRVIWPSLAVEFYSARESALRAELVRGRPRFIVSDLLYATQSPPDQYPWTEPIVFQRGRYAVHRFTGLISRLSQ